MTRTDEVGAAPTNVYWCELALVEGAVHEAVTVRVHDGRFASVDVRSRATADAVHLRGLTIPGLANSHSHAFHRALRGRTQTGTGSFWTWRDVMYRAAERLDPDSYHRLARATFAEMALAGITAVGEFHYLHHGAGGVPYANRNAMAEALLVAAGEAGIRITLLDTLYLHGGLTAHGYEPASGAQVRYCDANVDDWIERVEALAASEHRQPNERVGAAIHSVRAVDPNAIAVAASWAQDRGVPLHAHVSEQPAENDQCLAFHEASPVAVLDQAGAVTDRFTAVHATHVTADDTGRLAQAGASVCLCPTTERDLGDGIGPSAELRLAGVPMTLGSDSHAVIDMFEEARAVELDERLRSGTRGVHPAVELLAMATAAGHRSLGWPDAGTIGVGNRADLVTVSLGSVRTAGTTGRDGDRAAVEAIVFAASAADVTHVMIDGNLIVEHGRHGHIEVAHELETAISDLMTVVSA